MRMDRLLGIMTALLNRGVVSSRDLAERFEVSPRTIARDMCTLEQAGIPVRSIVGAGGGYEILDTFRPGKGIATAEDWRNIVVSLQALCSAYDRGNAGETLARFLEAGVAVEQRMSIDLGVRREGDSTSESLALLDRAIAGRAVVAFAYTGADGQTQCRLVEPLVLSYRWYAWYLLAYCRQRQDYRIFKLSRMTGLTVTDEHFAAVHPAPEELLDTLWNRDDRVYHTVRLRCRGEDRVVIHEYFSGTVTEELPDGGFVLTLQMPEGERPWLSRLLGFGGRVEVLEPPELRQRLLSTAKEILGLYENPDNMVSPLTCYTGGTETQEE